MRATQKLTSLRQLQIRCVTMQLPPAKRVLVVDDHQDLVESFTGILRLFGHEVETASDGASAVSLASAQRPEIVFLDIGLPGRNGYEVCADLRRELGCDVRIFAVTAYGDLESRRQAKAAGFDGHFVKPVQPLALLQEVDLARVG